MTAAELTQEDAFEVACHLVDDGHEVCEMGSGPPYRPMNMASLPGIHALWVRAKIGGHPVR